MKPTVAHQTGEKLLRIVMFTLMISAMSGLMFVIVIPNISKEFNLTIAQVSWLSSAYSLIYAVGAVTYGKLADQYKLKNLVTFGLVVFAIGSFIGLVSQTFWMALLARCLQAVGAATIPAIAMLIPVRYFPFERRGSATAMIAVGLALGSAIGPIISSFIVSVANWRWLFVIPIFVLFTIPFYRKYLSEEVNREPSKFDGLGSILLVIAVTLLLLGVTNGMVFLISGLLTLILFILRICNTDAPFIEPKLFKNRSFTLGLLISFLVNGMGFSFYFLSPLFLNEVQHLSASWIGFAMVPAAIASALFGRKGGKLADLLGNAYLFFVASGLLIISFVLLSSFIGSSAVWIAAFLIFGNVGQSFMLIALSNSISRTLPQDQVGVGMGMLAMLNFMAGGLATGIYSKFVDLGSEISWNPVNFYANGSIYSNIFFALAILLAAIWLLYYWQFGREKARFRVR